MTDTRQELIDKGEWFGHPKGLTVLFFTEMWERFCYYGMRGLLVLYLTKSMLQGDEKAFAVYAAFTALVYMAPVIGGRVSDKILGHRIAIIFGALMMAIGEFMILGGTEGWLYFGMAAIIVGNGYFKSNISTLVGKLYPKEDKRRDSGYTIFYIGVNIGSLLATLVCVWIGEHYGFKYGFGVAGIGMLLGILIYVSGLKLYRHLSHPPFPEKLHRRVLGPLTQIHATLVLSIAAVPLIHLLVIYNSVVGGFLLVTFAYIAFVLIREGIRGGKVLRDRIVVFIILCLFNIVFWALFEQAGTSLTLFADRNVDRNFLGLFDLTAGQTQFFNPLFIILMGSLFSALWVWLTRHNLNPSIPAKFGIGIVMLGIGYLLTHLGKSVHDELYLVPLWIIIAIYFFHTVGELFISPIGLSMVSKLAPARLASTMMGTWYLSTSASNFVAGKLATLTGAESSGIEVSDAAGSLFRYIDVYTSFGWVAVVTGIVVILFSPILNRMMHGIN